MIQQRESKVNKGEKANQHSERKPYSKPQLTEYGHLEKMTQGPTLGGTGDFRNFRDGVRNR